MSVWARGEFALRDDERARIDDLDDVEPAVGAEDAPVREPSRASAEYAVRLLDAALLRIDAAVAIDPDDLSLAALLATRDRALGR